MSTALPQIAARTEVTTTLSGSWTLSSPLFARHAGQQLEKVYYAAVELNVPLMGTYSFTGNSAIRMDGRLYDGDFDPADPNQNLITFDVKSADQEQFEITASLQADHKYTLIVTPRTLDSVGEFSVASSGPASISLPRTISPSTSPTQSSCEYHFCSSLFY